MKKVTVYFKSGNKVSFKASKFDLVTRDNGERRLNIENISLDGWMFDLNQIECFTITKCWW